MTSTGYVNPDDADYDYGPCDTDRRHIFNLTTGVQTPNYSHAVLRAVASNWRMSGILRLTSGRRLNVTVTTDPARTGIVGQRASLIGSTPYGDEVVQQLSESRGVCGSRGGDVEHPAAERARRADDEGRGHRDRQNVPCGGGASHRGTPGGLQCVRLVQPRDKCQRREQFAGGEQEQRPVGQHDRG